MALLNPGSMGGQVPSIGEPRNTAVVVDTPEGRLAFPQVAAAMMSPELIEAIAQAVYNKMQDPNKSCVPEQHANPDQMSLPLDG